MILPVMDEAIIDGSDVLGCLLVRKRRYKRGIQESTYEELDDGSPLMLEGGQNHPPLQSAHGHPVPHGHG